MGTEPKTKKIYQSKTFWAGITTIVGGIAGLCTGTMQYPEALIAIVTGIGLILNRTAKTDIG
jgi:hypothetical protein